MITDDPGTPGNGHFEINTAWTGQRTPGSTLVGLPQVDANYGVGDRLQLNYQTSWNLLRDSGGPMESGLSDTQLAVKWRFYDDGLKLSMYPRFTFVNPGSDADRRGLTDSEPSLLVPFEVQRNFGGIWVNCDFGYTFSRDTAQRGWIGGLCVGREIRKGWELDLEVHGSSSDDLDRSEEILNLGTRVDLSPNSTLLLAIGRDLHNSTGLRTSLLSYVGVQVRL